MQNTGKIASFNIKHIEPIKIRKVRISSRKSKASYETRDKNSSSEHVNSTAVSQQSLTRTVSSRGSNIASNINFSSNFSGQEGFNNIQEIHENPENEEDSLILELNELLSQQMPLREEPKREAISKPPLVNLKIKLREKKVPVKTERVMLKRVASHRLIL